MDTMSLIDRLEKYGADIQGIEKRFMGDVDLYEKCFSTLFEDRNLTKLQEALSDGKYDDAFEAAHALKGVIGNLGLTPLYEKICILVESLRVDNYTHVDAELRDVQEDIMRLKETAFGNSQTANASENIKIQGDKSGELSPKKKRKLQAIKKGISQKHLVLFGVLTLILAVVLIWTLFSNLTKNYADNMSLESAQHLEEINYQIKLYIESNIENDWLVAYSIRNSFTHSVRDNDTENITEFLKEAKNVWGVDDIIIYTKDGTGIKTSGEKIANDVASNTIVNATRDGEYIDVVQSTMIYTVSVDTNLRMNGERIVAISVERNLNTFLDDMHFSSFDNAAYIYLTENNGGVISKLTLDGAAETFNIRSELDFDKLTCLTDPEFTGDLLLYSEKQLTFILSRESGNDYVVMTPIISRHQKDMNLIYIVPDTVVNETMNQFSTDVSILSIAIILILAVLILAVFIVLYINRKRQFNAEIISRERTFDLLVKNTKTAFALISTKQEKPIYISVNVNDIIGTTFKSLTWTGKGFHIMGETDEETDAIREINRTLAEWDGKDVYNSGYMHRAGDAENGYYEVQLYPADDGGGEYVAIIQDVTQQYRREEVLKDALEMTERSNAAKTRFLSNMSHDIRTPMNAIVNMTNFAKESKNDPAQLDKYLDIIAESSAHLLRLINDILDLSRIESGQMVIESVPFNLKKEVEKLSDIVRPLCQNKRQTLKINLDDFSSRNVLGDHVKVSQIIMNLLGNAVKFTPEGGNISLTVEEIPSLRNDIISVRFIVEDTGMGISAEDKKSIFDAFMRADDRRISKIEGTGLGLSICKSYVEAMGGMIDCRSEEGKGSTFTVELFFKKAGCSHRENEPQRLDIEYSFQGKRCLLCEDNETNRLIARKLLEGIGFSVDIASDGREGVERFTQSEIGYYDIIYTDIQMPVMDGYEAAHEIRGSVHPQAKTIPIIAVTANVFAEDVERARLCGMNGHIGKPIDRVELISETNILLNKTNGGQ